MWDWLSNLWDSKDWVGSLFGAAGSAFGEKQSGMMTPKGILGGVDTTGRGAYGNASPQAGKVPSPGVASYNEIMLRWDRRFSDIMANTQSSTRINRPTTSK